MNSLTVKMFDGSGIDYRNQLSTMQCCDTAKDRAVAGVTHWRDDGSRGGDGKRENATMVDMTAFALGGDGDLFVLERYSVRKIDTLGNVTTILHGGVALYSPCTSFCIVKEQLFWFDLIQMKMAHLKPHSPIDKIDLTFLWGKPPTRLSHVSATPFDDFLISYPSGISILENKKPMKITEYCNFVNCTWVVIKAWMCKDKTVWALLEDYDVILVLIKGHEIVHTIKMDGVFMNNIYVNHDGRIFGVYDGHISGMKQRNSSIIVELNAHGIVSKFFAQTPHGPIAVDETGLYYRSCNQVRKIVTLQKGWKKETHYRLLSEDKLVVKTFLLLFAKKRCIINCLPRDIVFLVLQMLEVYIL